MKILDPLLLEKRGGFAPVTGYRLCEAHLVD
jgi:hypothetical protein